MLILPFLHSGHWFADLTVFRACLRDCQANSHASSGCHCASRMDFLLIFGFIYLFIFFCDNSPKYCSQEFKNFAAAFGFTQITSSPGFAQINGEAERRVQSVKCLLKKTEDPCLALLADRATPLTLRSCWTEDCAPQAPLHPTVLTSVLPGSINVTAKEREKREKDTTRFNPRNCVRDLRQLTPGQPVWITDTQSGGTVLSSHSTKQPCIVDGRTGTVMRNKHHLFIFQKSSPLLPHTPSTPPQPSEPTTMGSPERPKYHSPQTLKSSQVIPPGVAEGERNCTEWTCKQWEEKSKCE